MVDATCSAQLDNSLSHLSEKLLQHHWPHLLRPSPCATIVQFQGKPGRVHSSVQVAVGTSLVSPPVRTDKLAPAFSYTFQTIEPLVVYPIKLNQVNYVFGGGSYGLALHFNCEPGVLLHGMNLTELPIYIYLDLAQALDLRLALAENIDKISLQFYQGNVQLGDEAVSQVSVQVAPVFSEEITEQHAQRGMADALRRFFTVSEIYCFFTLKNFQTVLWPDGCDSFTVFVSLQKPLLPEIKISSSHLRLHCVPAVNRLQITTEPIHLHHRIVEYPLVLDSVHESGLALCEVLQVNAYQTLSGEQYEFRSASKDWQFSRESPSFYSRRELQDKVLQHYLCFTGTVGLGDQSVSCLVDVCNGAYPQHLLEVGSLQLFEELVLSQQLQGSNLISPRGWISASAPNNDEAMLISLVSVNHSSFTELCVLQKFLLLHVLGVAEEARVSVVAQVQGIQAIKSQPFQQVVQGIVVRGVNLELQMEDAVFICPGQMQLFGCLLLQIFRLYVHINHRVNLTVTGFPSGIQFSWSELNGGQPLL